mmetsp:Transcript_47274/g.88058  ORF Transcript_47274/g.88058 Transcript_47274/m.88058 type:complete len:1288 (-) Transcript_47274:184-4047(-)
MSSRRQSAPAARNPSTPGSRRSGGRQSMPAGAPSSAKKNTDQFLRGLFDWLDLNSDGVIEEHEWEVGCKSSRTFFRGRQQSNAAVDIFKKLDSAGLGSLVYEDVEDNAESVLEAMGIPADQGLEALYILKKQRAKEVARNVGQGALDLMMHETSPEEKSDQGPPPSETQQGKQQQAELARLCSDRRAQVLRRFLAVLDADGFGDPNEHLAIRAKQAAHAVVTGDALQTPPDEMQVGISMDALHAGGENVWVSAEISVAKQNGGAQASEEFTATSRVPADLLIVVDVSGSMNTSLPSVRKCLASLASLIDEQDRLSVVKFDDKATLVMPWTEMDKNGVEEFALAREELVSCGGTSYLPVFEKCFKELLDEPVAGRSRTMLFISDGAPMERDADILRTFSAQLKLANLSVVSVGFGSGTKSDLMSSIAHCGCGPFVYIAESKDIPRQLGRIWAAVAHTSLSSVFAVVRPLAGSRVLAVEGAFGSAELSLRPDGQLSTQQALVVQLGPVRHGASREFAMQLKLPPHLTGNGKINNAQLRQPLVEVSFISQAVADGSPIFLQRKEFLVIQIPSLLMETMLPFPVRLVLDNNLDEFDARRFLKHAADTFGVQENEIELARVLQGSVIIDMHLKIEPARAAQVFEDIATPKFQQKMSKATEIAGWKFKTMATPGQQVFRRVLQTRFADAVGEASKCRDIEACPEVQAVQTLAASDVANFLDPPGPKSMAALVKQDCEVVVDRFKGKDQGDNLKHDMLQLQSSHLAQYKSESAAASLECYEQVEALEAADVLESSTGDLSLSASFWETLTESMEIHMHDTRSDQVGVMIGLSPKPGKEVDFGHLVKQVCPVFEVSVVPEGGGLTDSLVSYAHPASTRSMKPLLFHSCHPCPAKACVSDVVRVPHAQSLKVSIDPRSCRHGGSLAFYADASHSHPLKAVNQNLVSQRAPKSFWQFCFEGSQLWFSFHPPLDACDHAEWGYHFEVEAVMPTEAPTGMLLQTGMFGLKAGPCSLSVRCMPDMFEIPAESVEVRELHGTASEMAVALQKIKDAVNKSLLLNEAASKSLGFDGCARILTVNGDVVRSKQQLTRYGGSDTAQLALTADTDWHRFTTETLLKSQLRKVPDKIVKTLMMSTVGTVPAPRQPEIVNWKLEGSDLQLCWQYGWAPDSCKLRAREVNMYSLEPLSSPDAFFMETPVTQIMVDQVNAKAEGELTASNPHEPLRVSKVPVPAPLNTVLQLDLKHPLLGQLPENVGNFTAWLVPSGYHDILEELVGGSLGKFRQLSQKGSATLVIDSA